jgi:hypothetical protein
VALNLMKFLVGRIPSFSVQSIVLVSTFLPSTTVIKSSRISNLSSVFQLHDLPVQSGSVEVYLHSVSVATVVQTQFSSNFSSWLLKESGTMLSFIAGSASQRASPASTTNGLDSMTTA